MSAPVHHDRVTFQDVLDARVRIRPFVHRTPVLTCRTLDGMAGRRLFFKCENFQKVGAFKYRGATNAVQKLAEDVAARGVVTHSSGNHAQALALAARVRGVPAHIVMPTNTPAVKRRAVAGYGACIYDCEPTQEAREAGAARVVEETGGTLIHPNNDPDVIAGQGTCALELLEEMASHGREEGRALDAIVAPVGGGGLISGVCLAVSGRAQMSGTGGSHSESNTGETPVPLVLGAEPSGADDAARSFAEGKLIPLERPDTIADGLRTGLGSNNWPIIRDHVERIVTIDDDAIIRAMRLVWERIKIIIEPSSATAVAAVLSEEFRALEHLDRVGVILSGGNVDLDHLPWMKPRMNTD